MVRRSGLHASSMAPSPLLGSASLVGFPLHLAGMLGQARPSCWPQQSLATAISMYGSKGWPSPASSTPQYKSCSTLPLSQRA